MQPGAERPLGYAEQVLLRYRYDDGRLQAAFPMRAVEDGRQRVVAWLAARTEIMYWALPDGRDPRVLPLEERFDQHLGTAARRWRGNGVLRVIPIDQPYQVIHFWNDAGEFAGWYINLEAPKTRHGPRLDTVDWHLDLWIDADGVPSWKDEEEASAAVVAGQLTERDLRLARDTGERIIDGLDDWPRPIGDWRTYVAPDEWCALDLPNDWAQ